MQAIESPTACRTRVDESLVMYREVVGETKVAPDSLWERCQAQVWDQAILYGLRVVALHNFHQTGVHMEAGSTAFQDTSQGLLNGA